jgi:hypothetical protein
MVYEYWVVPAPRKGEKGRGLKSSEERFAFALTTLMNTMAVEGWEYQRADALPCDERSGLTGTKTTFHNVLVFRRPHEEVGIPRKEAGLLASPAAPMMPAAPSLGAAIQPVGSAPALGPAASDD